MAAAVGAAASLPCPFEWLRSPLDAALGWLALPFVSAVTGVAPDTGATIDRLTATVRNLEGVLGRLQTETADRRARRTRQSKLRLAALEGAIASERERAAALDAHLVALQAEVATLPQLRAALATAQDERAALAAEMAALRNDRAAWEATAAELDRRLVETTRRAAVEIAETQRTAAAHADAIDAGWRTRVAAVEHDAAVRLASATARADAADARQRELTAAIDHAERQLAALRDHTAATHTMAATERDTLQSSCDGLVAERDVLQQTLRTVTAERDAAHAHLQLVAAERDALQVNLQAAAAREQGLAAQALQLEAALSEVASHADLRERAAAQRWQAWGEELEARAALERTRLTVAIDERQQRLDALTRIVDDLHATHATELARQRAEHERVRAAAGELEVRLTTAETQIEMERRAHDSALTDAYQTLTEREHDLDDLRQRAQRLESARATAVHELRALRTELEGLRAADAPSGSGGGAGTMAGAISRLLKSNGERGPGSSDDESNGA